jgi:hypothetical protein
VLVDDFPGRGPQAYVELRELEAKVREYDDPFPPENPNVD